MNNRLHYIRKLYFWVLLMIISHVALSQHTITGKVTDAQTNEELTGATVRVKGTTQGAVTDINGRYTLLTEKEAIIHERDVELALEGHRWFDLIRWSFDPEWGIDMQEILADQINTDDDGSFFIKGKHEFMPIPIREINLNQGSLKQNPGW